MRMFTAMLAVLVMLSFAAAGRAEDQPEADMASPITMAPTDAPANPMDPSEMADLDALLDDETPEQHQPAAQAPDDPNQILAGPQVELPRTPQHAGMFSGEKARQGQRGMQIREKIDEQLADLNLTESQQQAIDKIFDEAAVQTIAWRRGVQRQTQDIREKIEQAKLADDKEQLKALRAQQRELLASNPVKPAALMAEIAAQLDDTQRPAFHERMAKLRETLLGPDKPSQERRREKTAADAKPPQTDGGTRQTP